MTRPTSRPEAEATRIQAEADAWARARALLPDDAPPWSEREAQQMTYLTETRDDLTGEHPPLRKRNR